MKPGDKFTTHYKGFYPATYTFKEYYRKSIHYTDEHTNFVHTMSIKEFEEKVKNGQITVEAQQVTV